MTTAPIGRLHVADLRAAWPHEAHNFTPWLFANIDVLGDAVGMRLTPEDSEVRVETFAADILARNAMDDSLVLIENQLEGSDHSHLGQIMTYLAGLEAKTVIWIARDFRDSHLSAIKWLNEHTAEQFSFFAVQLKAVRIGDSPFAPLLEVLERPNAWERQLHAATVAQREGTSERGQQRLAFWTAYNARVPSERERTGEPQRGSNVWRVLEDRGLIISRYVAVEGVGLFIRGLRNEPGAAVPERLQPHAAELESRLGVPIGENDEHFFSAWTRGDYTDESQWPHLIDWLAERSAKYEQAIVEILPKQRHDGL